MNLRVVKSLIFSVVLASTMALQGFAEADNAKFNFESDLQGWSGNPADSQWGYGKASVAKDTSKAFAGAASMKVTYETGKKFKVLSNPKDFAPGQKVTFRVFVPSDTNISSVQPFYQDKAWGWKDKWVDQESGMKKNQWFECNIEIPADIQTPINAVGMQINTKTETGGTFWIDSVTNGTESKATTQNAAGDTKAADTKVTDTKSTDTKADTTVAQPKPKEEMPKTGDEGILIYTIIALASLSTIIIVKKLKTQTNN